LTKRNAACYQAVMKILLLALALIAPQAHAVEGDLVLPDARFLANFDRFICNDFAEEGIPMPTSLEGFGLKFDQLQVDGMTVAALITANFEENGQACRYSALLQRGARSTLNLKQSKAFSADAAITCEAGKAVIDALVAKMSFSVTKPINYLGLRVPAVDTAVCGADAKGIKIVFARDRNVNLKNQQQ
jgi:hypothetical protein